MGIAAAKNFKDKMAKVNDHASMIKFTQNIVDNKADQVELENLRIRNEALEIECDEVRQRSMKGNLILSSPNSQNNKSLLAFNQVTDAKTGSKRVESARDLLPSYFC